MTPPLAKPDTRTPHPFPPPWAEAWGDDGFGLWAEFAVLAGGQEMVQRMRWIEAGEFLMGEAGADGFNNERPQHRVTLGAGFWLADTTCTQGLWQAVMGGNPSHFHAGNGGGADYPVEMVSWNMAQDFFRRLQGLLPECRASLPTEAEWEYACRAGSGTAFSFGDAVTLEQVNFNGNHPYGGTVKWEWRQRTVAVQALPANGWGLYQMHGNVWEWCADRQRAYGPDSVRDPGLADALDPALAKGASRVLRGGSWFNDAGNARSAFRYEYAPDGQDDLIGFRLVMRSKPSK